MRNWLSVIVSAVLLASTASATSPTQVVNVNDPTLHPYQEYASTSCTEAGDCAILFPAITTGRTLVQHASCDITLPTSSSVTIAYLVIQLQNPRNVLPVFTISALGGTSLLGMNADTFLFFTKGQQPRIDVYTTGGGVALLECTVSGYYN